MLIDWVGALILLLVHDFANRQPMEKKEKPEDLNETIQRIRRTYVYSKGIGLQHKDAVMREEEEEAVRE